ncbi:hypothetical protein [Pleionea litopenaei]|uniref:Uncharacterized protein n=1 Tax=Pleionea litopenaei TaxID=3070815 RepID=A0AA51X633_9GAMM|nr:hypothetical protein [Pleionea sp. HL-JVS1]WMS86411.1 hypothetical protein Q9312_14410 [Pleionea sp. HL-JVS1]
MNGNAFPLLIGLELAVLLNLVLGAGLWFSFRELKRLRKNYMATRRDHARLKRQMVEQRASDEAPDDSSQNYFDNQLEQLQQIFAEEFPEQSIDSEVDTDSLKQWIYHLRYKLLTFDQEHFQNPIASTELLESFEQQLESLRPLSKAAATEPTSASPHHREQHQHEDSHYRNLYDELLITLQKSKETIRSLALRLSDIIDDGMDEDKLNALLEELNNSMEAFGELSGITTSDTANQLEDEVKAIRLAYEKGMNLMENFENALKHQDDVTQAVNEHYNVVDANRNNYESGETLDRDQVLANNKRYTRMLDEAKLFIEHLGNELNNGKEIIGDFLAMTRKFQDQSTRIVILQSREKQLNSDLKQLKLSNQDALSFLAARDHQLLALHRKYVEESASELDEKLCVLAGEIYRIEVEISELNGQEDSGARNKRQELVKKRLAVEEQIKELCEPT